MRELPLLGIMLLLLSLTACGAKEAQSGVEGVFDSLSTAALYVLALGFAGFVIGIMVGSGVVTGLSFLVAMVGLVVWLVINMAWRGFV